MADLKWLEPAAVIRAKRECLGHRKSAAFYPAFCVITFLVVLAMEVAYYFLHGKALTSSWVEGGVLALFFALFFPGGHYVLHEVLGAQVSLSERGIVNVRTGIFSSAIEAWGWEDVERCLLARVTIDGQEHPFLIVHGKAGDVYPIGLGDTDPAKVKSWFGENVHPLESELGGSVRDLGKLMNDVSPPPPPDGIRV